MTLMRNIRLILAYDGTDFHGWQRQPDAPTIQGCLEEAIAKLTGAGVQLYGSGRTDAGVHALHQVGNFQTTSTIPCAHFVKALNDLLPPAVRVMRADDVESGFHARYSVLWKTYRYRIVTTPVCSPLLGRFVYHYPYPLDRAAMTEAARLFKGTLDFTSFAAVEQEADDEGKCRVRTVFRSRLHWRARSSLLVYDITGNGFLRYMVRNIVGTLMEVGKGKLTPADILGILAARDRSRAGPTAPAKGLCLAHVEYESVTTPAAPASAPPESGAGSGRQAPGSAEGHRRG